MKWPSNSEAESRTEVYLPCCIATSTSTSVLMPPSYGLLFHAFGAFMMAGTEGFMLPSHVLRTGGHENNACPGVVKRNPVPSTIRRKRAPLKLLYQGQSRGSSKALRSGRQSIEGGVVMPPAEEVDEYARFLAAAIRQHLDEEWIEQDCHEVIGEEAARIYRAAVEKGDTDMTTLVMDTGSGLENFDMGDAFVGPWDIANLVSDFLMQKMGAEVSGCSYKIPAGLAAAAAAVKPASFRLHSAMVQEVQSSLASDLARYRFLVEFMEDEDSSKWDEANTIIAVYQGYTPEDVVSDDAPGVRRGWAHFFPDPLPPDLRKAANVVEALEVDFPEDPDMLEGLEVIVETVYGGEMKKMDDGDAEKGIAPNPGYLRRATVCKWLYLMGFLQDDIKRVPDDPDELAELIAGRARLKPEMGR